MKGWVDAAREGRHIWRCQFSHWSTNGIWLSQPSGFLKAGGGGSPSAQKDFLDLSQELRRGTTSLPCLWNSLKHFCSCERGTKQLDSMETLCAGMASCSGSIDFLFLKFPLLGMCISLWDNSIPPLPRQMPFFWRMWTLVNSYTYFEIANVWG